MAYNDPQLLHLDSMLTNVSVAYDLGEMVGGALFPSVTVTKQSDKYAVFQRESYQIIDDVRAPATRANEVPARTLSRESYFAVEHALVDTVAAEDDENADAGLDPYIDATEGLVSRILMKREDTMQTIARTTGNYASGHTVTLSGTSQWSDYTNSDPIADIKTGRDAIYGKLFRAPNTMIAGYQVAAKLEDHPDFIERIKYSQRGVTTDEIIASILGIGRFVRAGGGKLTNALGQAETYGYMWGKDVVLAYVPSNPGKRVPAFGYEFTWPKAGKTMPTERWYSEEYDADRIRTRRRYDLKLIAVDSSGKSIAGYLIKNAVA